MTSYHDTHSHPTQVLQLSGHQTYNLLPESSCQAGHNVHKTGDKSQNPICGMLINSADVLMSLTLSAGQTRLIRGPLACPGHL